MRDRAMRALAALATVTACVLVVSMTAQAQPKVDAAALFKQHCQLCHGANGTSPLPNASFTDGVWVHGSSLKEIQNTITNGAKGTVMVGFASKLKPAEIEALAKYVRAFDKALK